MDGGVSLSDTRVRGNRAIPRRRNFRLGAGGAAVRAAHRRDPFRPMPFGRAGVSDCRRPTTGLLLPFLQAPLLPEDLHRFHAHSEAALGRRGSDVTLGGQAEVTETAPALRDSDN